VVGWPKTSCTQQKPPACNNLNENRPEQYFIAHVAEQYGQQNIV
jgi:hypothetical protein